ncbi:DEAD/DEAH box helicase [Candidatus Sororendozoicomonas aggregata]|uniref:DEAD/DEAH box helicase n=1 Tax=Candidatus Sororendozoicomonas aggregata TaxID=3073239 RepID=UPI002ED4896E
MVYSLRPYQQQAVSSVIHHFRNSCAPAVVVLPTGAGKSLVISELARLARGRVLALAHVKELVAQNHAKYESYGLKASIFSAGLGKKNTTEQVVFGSVQSVSRNLPSFSHGQFTLLVIDECHRVSLEEKSSYHKVIGHLKTQNANLKVLGLTATPYRLDLGWIYQYHAEPGKKAFVRTEEPRFFEQCIFELPLSYMIQSGFLTPPKLIDAPTTFYDFSQLKTDRLGHFNENAMNTLLQGQGRATAAIIRTVIEQAAEKQGVMIFAATVEHAHEIASYLPGESTGLITGSTSIHQRNSIINAFKSKKLKYLVNVSVLTTGFDAPHVDVIAILRPTASVSLYQQIVGRGLRLSPGKKDCLVLEFAGNLYDLFSPEVGSPKPNNDTTPVTITCPVCNFDNTFWGIVDDQGYVLEHYGRRCQGVDWFEGSAERCSFRFRFKECDACNGENDIAARRCIDCGKTLVDPDKKLRDALNLRSAMVIRCAGMVMTEEGTTAGGSRLKVTYHDEDGAELNEFFRLDTPSQQGAFYHYFGKQALINRGQAFRALSVSHIVRNASKFRKPDFVIADRKKHYWQIREKLYDYDGAYKKANSTK